MILKRLRSTKGFSFLEILVTIAIVATFGSIMMTVVMAAQKNTKMTDMVAFFDNRNLNAVSIFKTDPSQDYLSSQPFFNEMDYDGRSRTYTQYFDKNLNAVEKDSDNIKYRSTYEISIADSLTSGFKFENKEIKLSIKNMQISNQSAAIEGYELINSAGASGNVTIHTNLMEEGEVVNPGNPDPGNPDPGNPDPGNPDPENPDSYVYVSFTLSGGYFFDTGSETLVKYVKKGSKFSDITADDETGGNPILPAENKDFTKKDSDMGPFTGWAYSNGGKVNGNDEIKANITVTGEYNIVKNEVLVLNAKFTDRLSWDITYSELLFTSAGSNLMVSSYEGIKLSPSSGFTGNRTIYNDNTGSLSDLKGRIRNPQAPLSIQLNITYKYVDVNSFLNSQNKTLMYNGAQVPVSIRSQFDSSGSKFHVGESGKQQLKNTLGLSGDIDIAIKLIPESVAYGTEPQGKAGKYAAFLNVETVGKDNRKLDEKYRIRLVKSGQPDTYQIQIIGENGDNIMSENYERDRPWGQANMITKNLNFAAGGVGNGVDEIHTLTLYINGWKLKFADDPNMPDTDLRIHHVNACHLYKGTPPTMWEPFQPTPDMPTESGSSIGKAYLHIYGSIDWQGNGVQIGWYDVYSWTNAYTGKRQRDENLTGPVTCPDMVGSTVNLPSGFEVN